MSSTNSVSGDSTNDINSHLIYTTLTSNSTTLYTNENLNITSCLNINCTELVSEELGYINSNKDSAHSSSLGSANGNGLKKTGNFGSIIINGNTLYRGSITVNLMLYYFKYLLPSNDLITIVTICTDKLNQNFVLNVLNRILKEYKIFKEEQDALISDQKTKLANNNANQNSNAVGSTYFHFGHQQQPQQQQNSSSPKSPKNEDGTTIVGDIDKHKEPNKLEFKIKFNQIIKFEELKLSKYKNYYSAANNSNGNTFGNADEVGLANDEIDEVRNMMNENIERVIDRGERISLLVNKTDRLNNVSSSFRRRTISIRRKFWWKNFKFFAMLSALLVIFMYLFGGEFCGLPLYSKCFEHGGGSDGDGSGRSSGGGGGGNGGHTGALLD
ncbi:hypothetical protein PACTADRAFT_1271 [Pachysolen tannophilus NRRL Y-2460]|uniref:V-SNARE coiled-coil homology domain-containing protein n=1 Tax=Pachysolen tannophilus NRRL Y-2460 TaxID=669874 RepID=A0A1E4TY79_PACTA|nr:hypothetical protein PACTADRAFT_1271 [Pachysolen tannophilus NRRL Y-2460]